MSNPDPRDDVDGPSERIAHRYAQSLLTDLGARPAAPRGGTRGHPAERWAASGLMAVTGERRGAALLCPVPLASCADACLDAFRALTASPVLPGVTGAQLLAERTAFTDSVRNGAVSPGGSCRLLPCRDGWIGVTLARPDDWDLVPAWLQGDPPFDWAGVTAAVKVRVANDLLARGRLLGLAVVDATGIPDGNARWFDASRQITAAARRPGAPRVVDLSALWAGPLCSHLWHQAGAEVTKVESTRRPDGARSGHPGFFDLLNRGKRSLALDLHTAAGRRALLRLIGEADIVLEGSRPRALRQMGIVAEDILAANPGLSWISITGYGRREPGASWIAYGDDAGVAAGLSAIMHAATGHRVICGDAIADPLTGLHAALAGWASWQAGGGHLIDLSLVQTVRHCIAVTAPPGNDYRDRYARWQQHLEQRRITAQPPRRRDGATASTP